jgi:hypothetical protein
MVYTNPQFDLYERVAETRGARAILGCHLPEQDESLVPE